MFNILDLPQIRPANRRHCALYKFIYLLAYLTLVSSKRHLGGDELLYNGPWSMQKSSSSSIMPITDASIPLACQYLSGAH